MVEPIAHMITGAMPFSQLDNEELACIAFDPRCKTDNDSTAEMAPGFHKQYAMRLLQERAGRKNFG